MADAVVDAVVRLPYRTIKRRFTRRQDVRVDLAARNFSSGRVASDLSDIIKRHPVELAALLRTTKGLTTEDIARLARNAQKAKDK